MQLPRVIIAAVFFVIGALIAIPALMRAVSSDSEPAAAATTSPSPSGSGSGTPSPGGSARPVTATIGSVSCPARTVKVTVRNTGNKTEDFAIEKDDDSAAVPGQIRSDSTRTVAVHVREDRRTRITVTWANKRVETKAVKANCDKAAAEPTPTKKPPEKLPHTGPDTIVWARAATGVGVILTGAIIFWYGGIWPRRRDQVFPKKNS